MLHPGGSPAGWKLPCIHHTPFATPCSNRAKSQSLWWLLRADFSAFLCQIPRSVPLARCRAQHVFIHTYLHLSPCLSPPVGPPFIPGFARCWLAPACLGLVSAPLLPAGHAPRTVVTENLPLNFVSASLNETYWHVQIIYHLFCYKQPWNFGLFNLLHCFHIKTKAVWHYTRTFSKRMGT